MTQLGSRIVSTYGYIECRDANLFSLTVEYSIHELSSATLCVNLHNNDRYLSNTSEDDCHYCFIYKDSILNGVYLESSLMTNTAIDHTIQIALECKKIGNILDTYLILSCTILSGFAQNLDGSHDFSRCLSSIPDPTLHIVEIVKQ